MSTYQVQELDVIGTLKALVGLLNSRIGKVISEILTLGKLLPNFQLHFGEVCFLFLLCLVAFPHVCT